MLHFSTKGAVRCTSFQHFPKFISTCMNMCAQPKFNNDVIEEERKKTIQDSNSAKTSQINKSQKEDRLMENDENVANAIEKAAELPAYYQNPDIGFWQSERGIILKDQIFTGVGRVLRMFTPKERSDNIYEYALAVEEKRLKRFNSVDEEFIKQHGPECALGLLIFGLGGAVKLKFDDRWIDDARCLRTPKRKDFRLEAIDVRKTAINHLGLKYISGTKHIRYVNAGDAKHFDDQAMACLHPLADSLEFLDVSGTSVTERGLGYLRLFSNLKYLNLSRLQKTREFENLLPYLMEILPANCCVMTQDETPSDMYGVPIPFRHPKNPKKDLPITTGNKKIGDLVVYEKDMLSVDFYRLETIHELWMTPLIGRHRKARLMLQEDADNNILMKLNRYILKANTYKPLL